MGERKFSKVTKWEIALGAVASLMTGVVVGLVVRGRRRRAAQMCEPPVMPIPPEPPVDEDVFYGTVEEHPAPGMRSRRPMEDSMMALQALFLRSVLILSMGFLMISAVGIQFLFPLLFQL